MTGDDDRDDVPLNQAKCTSRNVVEYNIRPHVRTSRGGGGQQEGCCKLLRTPAFKRKVQAIVVDEAFLVKY